MVYSDSDRVVHWLDMDLTPTISLLRDKRVRVLMNDTTEKFGVLRGITSERLFIGEDPVQLEDVLLVDPAPLTCANCGDDVVKLTDGLCASCYREAAKRRPKPIEACEECGRKPAFRSPSSGAMPFLCTDCHAKRGTLKMHPAVPTVAECLYEDVTSPMHQWQQIRGARFRCIRCKRAEKYDPALLTELEKLRD